MGGCRCTYRNCSVKSDGKTHMFHYPVFDKVRCHQWIINAQRQEFLNLKVSQLKNRVICQNHFKDDNFMNYKKEKLTFEAVPTEDGPFCDPTKWNNDKNTVPSFPLITEDIENEYLTYSEKKANYSIKYADFLTNCDLDYTNGTNSDPISLNNKNKKSSGVNRYIDKLTFQSSSNNNLNKSPKTALAVVNPYDVNCFQTGKDLKLQEIIIEDNAVAKEDKQHLQREYHGVVTRSALNNTQNEKQMTSKVNVEYPVVQTTNSTLPAIKKEPKVRIISEKNIKPPISIPTNLQSVSPSLVIKMPKKHENQVKQAIYSLEESTVKEYKPPSYSVDLQVDKVENTMYSIDFKEQTQENLPIYSINLSEQKQETPPVTYSIDLHGQQYENHPSTYSIDMNASKNENQPSMFSINLNEKKHEDQTMYSIDLNVERQDNLQPVYSIDLNVLKNEHKPVYSLNLGTNQSDKNESVIKLLKDKHIANLEYDSQRNSPKLLNNTMPPQQLLPKELTSQTSFQSKDQSKVYLLKNKISPNRLAAIEEKRKFNKKLRDAIESCLTKTSEENLETIAKSDKVITTPNIDREKDSSEQISSYLTTEPQLPSVQEYTLNFLESRLRQMENRLLNKIDQNSQKIQEIKNSFKTKPEQKTSSMQTGSTNGNVGSYKRYLYQEISQFLSPDCNSAVYEELFINKYSLEKKTENVIEVKKKRRCR